MKSLRQVQKRLAKVRRELEMLHYSYGKIRKDSYYKREKRLEGEFESLWWVLDPGEGEKTP